MMMSILEQRQIVEAAFLPLACRCTIAADDRVTLELRDPNDERLLLSLADIHRDELASSRSISQLVLRVRQQLVFVSSGMAAPQRQRSLA
ncbi:DUF1652 domain-containing protein [Pseudomonas sp. CNPSo 3701]|uniref:DUF1652 domain-containing protein n=1 Tax=Pseudomonas sp. CNPSo 3701 TaxID=3027943 RepID=UPI0023649E1D|nr:DUF1652 domain-containing protein [Pseudomonas sp. CNPSo 3701]MDD1508753.1 DUF1652 domain-containing protein [Pseudomonas sp. CNPSo 3701]